MRRVSRKAKDLTGLTFGRWRVAERDMSQPSNNSVYWWCVCECGERRSIRGSSLRCGDSVSCGCLVKSQKYKTAPGYNSWRSMIAHCYSEKATGYADYGGRGIKVCDRWRHDFHAFIEDVGPRPSKAHSIDRIDVNGNYEPGNVRWATALVQCNNRRCTRYVVYKGERLPFREFARREGCVLNPTIAWNRISRCGWDLERAIKTPPMSKGKARA